MASTGDRPSFVLDGRSYLLRRSRSMGAELLERFAREVVLPLPSEPPYLFCGNGSCRDCNVLVEGLADVASCRVPLAPGMSLRSGEGSGEPNVLARKLGPIPEGAVLSCDVAVIGAGPAGRSSADAFRARGLSVELFDARSDRVPKPRPAAVVDGDLVVLDDGHRRPVDASTIVLATGARDLVPSFPGSPLPGVLPMDLLERYAALRCLPGVRFLLVRDRARAAELRTLLLELGAQSVELAERVTSVSGELRVERAVADGEETAVDTVALAGVRAPSLEIAKALGCRTRYDRERAVELLEVDEEGRTSVEGVLAVGGIVEP